MTTTGTQDALRRWIDAERDGERDRLEALLTDDFVGIGPVGFMLPKAAWVGRIGPELRYERLELDEISIRDYGNASVVVARQHADGDARGHPLPADTRVSFVMVRAADGERRIAAIQYSFMAPPGAAA